MTTPDIFATGYSNSANAFLNAPAGQGNYPVHVRKTATVPASTASGSVIGFIPFNKGASVVLGSGSLLTADLDTGTDVTFTLGYVYDDNVTYTNDADAFITSSAALQSAAALVAFNGTGGFSFEAEADGWIAITTGGGSTTTEGDLTLDVIISYEQY